MCTNISIKHFRLLRKMAFLTFIVCIFVCFYELLKKKCHMGSTYKKCFALNNTRQLQGKTKNISGQLMFCMVSGGRSH